MVRSPIIFAAIAAIAMSPFAAATDALQPPKTEAVKDTATSQGCFKPLGTSLTQLAHVDETRVSSSKCIDACKKMGKPVMALAPSSCVCGDTYPPKDDLISDDSCDFSCRASESEACGGLKDAYSVYNTGLSVDVANDGGTDNATATSTTSPSATASGHASSGIKQASSVIFAIGAAGFVILL